MQTSLITWGHNLRVRGSKAILGDTGDSVASDWSLSRRPAHCEGVVTHISQSHVCGGLSIYIRKMGTQQALDPIYTPKDYRFFLKNAFHVAVPVLCLMETGVLEVGLSPLTVTA